MDELRIWLFGGLRVEKVGEKSKPFPTRESETIFCFLALNRGRFFQRERLLEYFYPDITEVTGKKRLRTALWRIKSVLGTGDESSSFIRSCNREVGFDDTSNYWLDVQEFESLLAGIPVCTNAVLKPSDLEALISAVSLYRGDILEGCHDEWCLWQKEQHKLMLLRAIEKIVNHFAAEKDWLSAISYAKQLLSYDALREHVHRSLMRFHCYVGDRPSALKQYENCQQLLRTELQIEPMRETTRLRDYIRSENYSNLSSYQEERGLNPHSDANQWQATSGGVGQLERAFSQLGQARSSLSREIERLKRLDIANME